MKPLKEALSKSMIKNLEQHIVYNYSPKTKDELMTIINKRIKNEGNNCDLNDIDISKVTNMAHLFEFSKFNGDISKWDVSNVTNMSYMFANSIFDGNISNWDVSNVEDMFSMFRNAKFSGDISKWNVRKVEDYDLFAENCSIENTNKMPKFK